MSQRASNRVQVLPPTTQYPIVERTAGRLVATLTRPDVAVVLCFCAIGLILTFAALARSPDFASALAQQGLMP